jgi:uncharacterized protein (DUF1501 family)
MSFSRRKFLSGLGAGALLSNLPVLPALASSGSSDYRALVCVFLLGGNDGNNMIVPVDSRYNQYSAVRPTSGGVGIPLNSLLPLNVPGAGAAYGLHPSLSALMPMWNAGRMAPLFNVGTLVQPTTLSEYQSKTAILPTSLFDHGTQQSQMQSASLVTRGYKGWGGQIADLVAQQYGQAVVPPMMSLSGNFLYTLGNMSHPLSLPYTGCFQLGWSTQGYMQPVINAYKQLLTMDNSNQFVAGAQTIATGGLAASNALYSALTGTTPADAYFNGLTTGFASQLRQIAKIISIRAQLGVQRQLFFVGLTDFDHHSNQATNQSTLFNTIGPALAAFDNAMVGLGTSSEVTTFTLSDFGRSLQTNSTGGTDHGWGNHQLIMGGAVKGLSTYGTFPSLTLNGPDDVGIGCWLPSTALDQYAATLSSWFGVSAGQMTSIFPNLQNFSTQNLGFMST